MAEPKHRQLTRNDRIKMEALLNAGHTQSEVARQLGVHRSTVCREYHRGKYIHRNSDYTEEERYSCDLGQKVHEYKMEGKGRSLKIGRDRELSEYIEEKIVENKYSPEAALADVEQSGIKFKTTISLRTLYRYIELNSLGLSLKLQSVFELFIDI